MFNRRDKQNLKLRARNFLWPRLGWRRSTQYIFHRIGRLPGTSYAVAAGFACGAAISFTPFVGFHFVLGGIIAWLIRANITAAVIGTAIGNPWTFPFIWTLIFNVGIKIGAFSDSVDANQLNFSQIFSSSLKAVMNLDMSYLLETAWPVFWPMLIGGIPTFILVWLGTYFPLKMFIIRYQINRKKKLCEKSLTL